MSIALKGAEASREAHPPSVAWRTFLRGLAVELDGRLGLEASAAMLRGAGLQMAGLLALVNVDSLEALELEMNGVLAEIGWGCVQLTLLEAERCVVMTHTGLPQIGSAGEPAGTWLAPVLAGLYQGWMAQQPGADTAFVAQIRQNQAGRIIIRYGR